MRTFTLLFTIPKDPKWVSKLIAWRLGTEYSHVCGIVSTGPIGLYDVYQASNGDVNGIDLCNFLKKNKVIKTCRINVEEVEEYYKLIRYLKKQRGKGYSEIGALASTVPFLRALGFGVDGDSEFICSEYMARALEEMKIFDYKDSRINADYVDPYLFETELIDEGFEIFNGFHMPEYKGE